MAWATLTEIARDNAAVARREMSRPPEACPLDGEPLDRAPTGGGWHCQFCGWTT